MARQTPIKALRTTRSALDAQAAASGLLAGEPYLITDEGRFAIGTSTSQYKAAAKQDEVLLRGYRNGLTLANSTGDAVNDITVSAGQAASDATNPTVITLSSLITKRTDAAWAVGGGNGAWLDGASMPDGTGNVFAIHRSDTDVTDVAISASMSPTLPSGYDSKTFLGSILRESGALVPFQHFGNLYLRTPKEDRSSTASLASTPIALSVPVGRPLAVILMSELDVAPSSDASNLIGSGDAASASTVFQRNKTSDWANGFDVTTIDWVVTNDAAEINFATTITAGNIRSNKLTVLGWREVGESVAGSGGGSSVAEASQADTDAGAPDSGYVSPETLAAWSGRLKKVSANLGDASASEFTITHNFGTRDVQVEVYRNSGNFDTVIPDVERTSINAVRITFASAPTLNQFRAVVMA